MRWRTARMAAGLVIFMSVAASQAPQPTASSASNGVKEPKMKVSHVHLGVRDLAAAVQWLEKVWAVKPTFKNEQMASVPFGTMTVIFDSVASDIPATIGFESFDCDGDYRTVIARGGVALEPPVNKPWGVRAAYIQGPGAIKFEIEQLLPRNK